MLLALSTLAFWGGTMRLVASLLAGLLLLCYWFAQAAIEVGVQPGAEQVGPAAGGGWIMPTGHKVRSAGETLAIPGRPVGMALGKDGAMLYVKDNRGLWVVGTGNFKTRQQLLFPKKGGAS